ncbi:MAG: hypothetical protein MJ208_03215 [Bacilli bacterium]|nr:hypothetical protein [Bacilli bacterium]
MKKLLLSLILLFTIPFNASCIKEITFTVTVDYADPNNKHCHWDKPTIAYMGKDYTLRFYDDEGWELFHDRLSIYIKTSHFDPIEEANWTYENHLMTIKGQFVDSDIEIRVTPDLIQP